MDDATIDAIIALAISILRESVIKLAIERIKAAHSRGGEVYEEVVGIVIAEANAWYGMYTPVYYRRTYTLTNRNNIVITMSEPEVSENSISCEWSVKHLSPHFGWTFGFPMRNGLYRPGADILASANGGSYTIAPPAGLDALVEQAITQACAAYGITIGG